MNKQRMDGLPGNKAASSADRSIGQPDLQASNGARETYEADLFRSDEEWRRIVQTHDVILFELMDAFFAPRPDGLYPRRAAMSLARYALSLGKILLFAVREPCDYDMQRAALAACGLFRNETDAEDALLRRNEPERGWPMLMKRCTGKRIAYLCYGFEKEYLYALRYGADPYFFGDLPREELMERLGLVPGLTPDKEALLQAIDSADVISFDVFDTVVSRAVLTPEDVDALLQANSPDINLSRRPAPGEAELEARLIRRRATADLINYASSRGKQVILCSDMHFREEEYAKLLSKAGITGYDRFFISCEYDYLKRDGLFEEVKTAYPGKRILHIGDSPEEDILAAKRAGLETFYIPSAYDAAIASGLLPAIHACVGLPDRCLVGCVLAERYRDPFAPQDDLQTIETGLAGFKALFPTYAAAAADAAAPLRLLRTATAEGRQLAACRYRNGKEWIALAEGYDVISVVLLDTALNRDVFWDRILYLRHAFSELLEYCKKTGRKVVLYTSTECPLRSQLDAVAECPAYKDAEDVRRDVIVCKRNRKCFSALREAYPGKRILYIGHDLYYDGILPRLCGIDTYRMDYNSVTGSIRDGQEDPPNRDQYLSSLRNISGASGIRAMELCVDRLFPQGQAEFCAGMDTDRSRLYGYAVLGPLVCGFLFWLKEELARASVSEVLFVSRDGWLVKHLYDQFFSGRTGIPSKYFYTSRHAAFLAVMEDFSPGYIAGAASSMKPEEVMRQFYGLSTSEILPWEEGTYADLTEYIDHHAAVIRKKSRQARLNAYRYFRKSGLEMGSKYALVDFIAMGTCQTMLERFAPFELIGAYFAISGTDRGFSEHAHAYLNRGQKHILERYVNMEYYMTSPEPSLKCYSQEGEPVFTKDRRRVESLDRIAAVQEGIEAFARDYYQEPSAFSEGISPEDANRLCRSGAFLQPREELIDDWSGKNI